MNERSWRIRYRDYWARRAFGSRVIFGLSCVSIATVMDLIEKNLSDQGSDED